MLRGFFALVGACHYRSCPRRADLTQRPSTRATREFFNTIGQYHSQVVGGTTVATLSVSTDSRKINKITSQRFSAVCVEGYQC